MKLKRILCCLIIVIFSGLAVWGVSLSHLHYSTKNSAELTRLMSHADSFSEQALENTVQLRFLYRDSDFELYGQDVSMLLAYLDDCFPSQMTYGTEGFDFERYAPKAVGKYKKALMWVTPENELLRLILERTNITGETMLSVRLVWETDALKQMDAIVTENTGDYILVKLPDSDAEPREVLWDCEGSHLTNPISEMDYSVGDKLTLWLHTQNNENAYGHCVYVVDVRVA